MTSSYPSTSSPGWQRFAAASLRTFHAYANWLVNISWRRFLLLSLLLLIAAGVLQNLPPFHWEFKETVSGQAPPRPARVTPGMPSAPAAPAAPVPPAMPNASESKPTIRIEKPRKDAKGSIEVIIDEHGVRIGPRRAASPASASASSSSTTGASDDGSANSAPTIDIRLPPGTDSQTVRAAVEEARDAIKDALLEARQAESDARQAARDAAQEIADAEHEANGGLAGPHRRVRVIELGEFLPPLAFLWIIASAIIKITYKRQIQAEAQAAQAVETAGAESLKRQVVEARMAAMQAQVEPHFLFNTLASIDHLIEVDPPRASTMQKNLIALLRAAMPTMREASGNGSSGVRELGRELAVIRPYLEILKVRMEERLSAEINVPDGLLSAEFPPMMLQTLVENAIKHGLEPKPEGGRLLLKAEIVHGKLAVTVADTGLGFGRAATAGTGVGLANIRERLQLLYGSKGTLTISEKPGGGTVAAITVPYRSVESAVP